MRDFSDWTGAGIVTAIKLFIIDKDGNKTDVTDDDTYAEVRNYLPGTKEEEREEDQDPPLYLVGRVAMTNANGDRVVKLFANATWESKLLELFEFLEFKMVEGEDDPEHLVSDPEFTLYAGNWKAEKMELFWHLPGPGKPCARVDFTSGNQTVSAFWCWPE